jgi:hypothetical protein
MKPIKKLALLSILAYISISNLQSRVSTINICELEKDYQNLESQLEKGKEIAVSAATFLSSIIHNDEDNESLFYKKTADKSMEFWKSLSKNELINLKISYLTKDHLCSSAYTITIVTKETLKTKIVVEILSPLDPAPKADSISKEKVKATVDLARQLLRHYSITRKNLNQQIAKIMHLLENVTQYGL